MLSLGGACINAGGLTSLRSFTSTVYDAIRTGSGAWMDAIDLLVKESPIEVLQSYMSHSAFAGMLGDSFWIRVVNQHKDHLVRLSLHRQRVSPELVDHVCINCPRLEELFATVNGPEVVCPSFSFCGSTYIGIARHTLYQCLPRQRVYAQCISPPLTEATDRKIL